MKIHISKRRKPLVRTAVYSFMTLAVVVIVSLLMLVVLGYSFNEKDGKLEQGGLLQFGSIPTGATVTLDELRFGSQTNTKSTIDAGNHSTRFDKQGYRTWSKSIYVAPGQIGWLTYARLIPTTITPQNIRSFDMLTSALTSPERKYMLLHEAADQPVFELANIQGDTVQYKQLVLPAESFTPPSEGKTQTFALDSWSLDEQAVLVRHTYDDDQAEWILLNRDSPEKSVNISTTFAIRPSKVVFAGNGNKLLFVQNEDIVRRINLDDQTLSRPLATRVAQFNSYDEKTIAYATTADDKGVRMVGYAATDIPEPQTIAVYPDDKQPLFAAMESYFGRRYISILHGQELRVVTGTLPAPGQKANLKTLAKQAIPTGASSMIMTDNGRFTLVQLPDGYATFDLELIKYDKTTWAVQPTTPRDIRWLDNYMIWADGGGMLRTYEFDGANQQNIMPVAEGFAAAISPNDKYIYGILKTDKGFELRRAKLILN